MDARTLEHTQPGRAPSSHALPGPTIQDELARLAYYLSAYIRGQGTFGVPEQSRADAEGFFRQVWESGTHNEPTALFLARVIDIAREEGERGSEGDLHRNFVQVQNREPRRSHCEASPHLRGPGRLGRRKEAQ